MRSWYRLVWLLFWLPATESLPGETAPARPYARQVAEQMARLQARSEQERAGAAEALGFLRAYQAQAALVERLGDRSAAVRRQATLALAWCADRQAVDPLLAMLDDRDWVARQAAHVALTNLTGMELPFNALAPEGDRTRQARAWRRWWSSVPIDEPPLEVAALLDGPKPWHDMWAVSASTTYRGPTDVLTDGMIGPAYWQTKNVEPPQWCTVDLGRSREISQVAVHQYGPQFVMTEYELATSLDNQSFEVVKHERGATPVKLDVRFAPRDARFVRITSFGSKRPIYPTTFFEIQIDGQSGSGATTDTKAAWRFERGLRALGALGGRGATEAILECLGPSPPTAPIYRPMVAAGIRSLGRLHSEAGLAALIELLDNTMWARRAAEALGDRGDPRALPALLAAYSRYAKQLDGKDPTRLPADDKMSFPSEDRMLETPYAIAYALCRLPLDSPQAKAGIRAIAPLVMANLPGDHDTFMLYEPEVGHWLTRYMMDAAGLRRSALEHAFELLGQQRRMAKSADEPKWPTFAPYRMSTWLPALCREPEDLPRLVALLQHPEGWVRINAAKALAWLGDRRAIEPLARLLTDAKAEADFGYNGVFKNEEYDDPAPRWREGLIRPWACLTPMSTPSCWPAFSTTSVPCSKFAMPLPRRWPIWTTKRRWPLLATPQPATRSTAFVM